MRSFREALNHACRVLKRKRPPIGEIEFRLEADRWRARFLSDPDAGVASAISLMRRQARTQPTIFRADEARFQDRNSVTSTFADIYRTDMWGQGSGGGSILQPSVALYLGFLEALLERHRIRSIVDVGCGDWQFTRYLRRNGVSYVGIDAAQSVVDAKTVAFGSPTVRFIHSDAAAQDWPEADLAISKDVLQHLPDELAATILKNCGMSRVSLVTNDYHPANLDCRIGDTRPIDPTKPPFDWEGHSVIAFDRKVSFLSISREVN